MAYSYKDLSDDLLVVATELQSLSPQTDLAMDAMTRITAEFNRLHRRIDDLEEFLRGVAKNATAIAGERK